MTNFSQSANVINVAFDNSDASLKKFTDEWPFATWQMASPTTATLSMPRQVLFAISSGDSKTKLAVMLRPDEAQTIANTLAKAAEAAIMLMIEEAQQ